MGGGGGVVIPVPDSLGEEAILIDNIRKLSLMPAFQQQD